MCPAAAISTFIEVVARIIIAPRRFIEIAGLWIGASSHKNSYLNCVRREKTVFNHRAIIGGLQYIAHLSFCKVNTVRISNVVPC